MIHMCEIQLNPLKKDAFLTKIVILQIPTPIFIIQIGNNHIKMTLSVALYNIKILNILYCKNNMIILKII